MPEKLENVPAKDAVTEIEKARNEAGHDYINKEDRNIHAMAAIAWGLLAVAVEINRAADWIVDQLQERNY